MRRPAWPVLVLALLAAVPARGAGDVTVALGGRRLVVTGDGADNAFTVGSGSGREVVVTGTDGTTVNGGASVSAPNVRGVRIHAGAGRDTVTVDRLFLPGTLVVRLGDDDDVLVVEDGAVDGSLFVRAGGGRNDVVVRDVTVAGNVTVRGGRQGGTITIDTVAFDRFVTLFGGRGRDGITLFNVDNHRGEHVRITTGDGDDQVLLEVASFDDDVDVDLGDGDDFLVVADVFFDDGAELDGGRGHDDVLIGFIAADDDVDFDGF